MWWENALTDLMLKSLLITTKNEEIRLIFRRVIAKITSIKTVESFHFQYNNTKLIATNI